MKDVSFQEITRRIEKAFPEFDIGSIGAVYLRDRLDRIPSRHGWNIVIAQKIKERKE